MSSQSNISLLLDMIWSSHLNILMTTVVVFTVVATPLVWVCSVCMRLFNYSAANYMCTLNDNSQKATVNIKPPVGRFIFSIDQIFASVASWHSFTLFLSNRSIWWPTTTTLRSQASLHCSCQIKPVRSIQTDKNRYFEVIPEKPSTPSPLWLQPAVIFSPFGWPGSGISICVGVCTP